MQIFPIKKLDNFFMCEYLKNGATSVIMIADIF